MEYDEFAYSVEDILLEIITQNEDLFEFMLYLEREV